MDSQKIKKIMVVSPSFHLGGIERTVSNLSNYFVTQNIDVSFVSLLRGDVFFELDKRIKVFFPTFQRKGNILNLVFYRLRLVLFLRSQIRKNTPDCILSMSDTFNGIVILGVLGLNVKVFIGDVTKPDRYFKWSTRLMKEYLYPYSNGFIAQTESAAEFYRRKFKDKLKIKVIHGAVKEVKTDYHIERESLIIVVGRLSIEKGQDRMIEIFEKVKNRMGWKLCFTADGPLKETLKAKIIEKNLSDEIILLGKVEDLDELYAKASIFAMPSRMEGFPNALCEAMVAGLPCICFDSFPAHEIIEDGIDGFIVKDGDYDAFANTIENLIESQSLRLEIGRNAQNINERLNLQKIGGEFLNFFNSLI